MEAIKKKLPLGIENFEEMINEGFYYVDKTNMIRDLLNRWGKVNLFTRPRRFGKSLNMSMLKCFLEIGCEKSLFRGLAIEKETALCEQYMGKFPVISISLKGVDGTDYETSRELLCAAIGKEAMRFQFLLEDDTLTEQEKRMYRQIIQMDEGDRESFVMSDALLIESLQTLSWLLEKHYKRKVIILIDEYDVPLAKASERDYYDKMILLLRGVLQQALKTNDSLYFAVLAGCLRVAKESIFTGLNNLRVFSVTTVRFDEYFGFTEEEVERLLEYYGLTEKKEIVRGWYDGYHFGNVDVYCPWDVISYCDDLLDDSAALPQNYWINTSSNDTVKHFLEKADAVQTKEELERLIAGETVIKEIHEELTYPDLYDTVENIWSALFMTGYLTCEGKPKERKYRLSVPNREIRSIFTDQIMKQFMRKVEEDGEHLERFCNALKEGRAAEVESLFASYLHKTISIRDTFVRKGQKENFYHGILLGILSYKKDWYVKSNEEAGDGYSDILIIIRDEEIGMILEVKYAEKAQLDAACEKALEQIEQNRYTERLEEEDCHRILKYGIGCYKKKCRVAVREDDI